MSRKSTFLLILMAATVAPAFPAEQFGLSDWKARGKAGDEAFSVGDFASAETNFRSALDACTEKSALPGLEVKLTNTLMSQGKFPESARELKKTLSQSKSISGEDSQDYAEALDLQAWSYQINGKMQPAIASLKQSISILERKAPGSSDLADAYEHMGLLNEMLAVWDIAGENYAKALEIRTKLAGSNSVEVADMYEKLGMIASRRGQQGEAARLYADALRIKESRGEVWKPYAPEPTERVVMFHYIPGAPNCRQASQDGVMIERVNANGVTVDLGISQRPSDFAKTTRALVRIHNGSQYDIDVLPMPPTFIQVTPTVAILKPLDPQQLAAKIEKKGESKAKWIKFWGADAMTNVTSYSYASGRGMPPVYGYVPNSFAWNAPGYGYGYQNFGAGSNRWNTNAYSNTMVPDYQARAEAYRKAEEATARSKNDAVAVREAALGPNRLRAGDDVQGALDFEYSKYKSAILRIPVGNAVYEFRFE